MYILFTTLVYLIFFGWEGGEGGGWGEDGRLFEFTWEGEGGVGSIRGWALINLIFSAFKIGAYSRWALNRSWALIRINRIHAF